ncbi:hypothetical protein CsSME_00042504 [Camellia sinensis var. sinensis]
MKKKSLNCEILGSQVENKLIRLRFKSSLIRCPVAAAETELSSSNGDDVDGDGGLSSRSCFSNHIFEKIDDFS